MLFIDEHSSWKYGRFHGKLWGHDFWCRPTHFVITFLSREVPYYHLYYLASLKGNVQSRNEKHILSMSKKTKWRMDLPLGFACPINPSKGPIIARKGRVISSHSLANRFRIRFGTNPKLLCGVIGPISTPNNYLNTVFDDVVRLRGSCRNNALPRSPREKLQLVSLACYNSLAACEKSFLTITRKEYDLCRSPYQMKTYSLG